LQGVNLVPLGGLCGLGDTRLQPRHLVDNLSPVDPFPSCFIGWRCTSVRTVGFPRLRRPPHLPSSSSRFLRVSRHGRPCGSGLAFAPGNVATRIRSITERPSLSPLSSTRCAISLPCGWPAVAGGVSGLPCSAYITSSGVGPACTPVIVLSVCSALKGGATDHLPFWFKPVSIFGLLYFTMSIAVHIC
jgi:hypothetical protein